MVNGKRIKIYLFLTIFITLVIFILFLPKITLADSPLSQGWFCAKTTWCDGEDYQQGTCTFKHVHRVKLMVDPANKPVSNNNDTYLVECLSQINNGAPDFRCTTGNSDLDLQAFASDNYSWLKNNWGYSLERDNNYGIFKVDNNQAVKIGSKKYKTGPSSGLIIEENNEPVSVIEWQSYVPIGKSHKFYFFQKIQPQPTAVPGQGGQQQATSFDWVNADRDCAVIQWDPAGRVFDALSLEPIPGTSVFLTKDDGKGNFVNASQFEPGIINPQLTNPQGGFSFYVSDGDYKLNINNLGSLGYERLASDLTEVNSKYNKIYYHLISGLKETFIYPAQTGEIIHQKGRVEYRDIPLISKTGEGKRYPLKIISAFYSVKKSSGKVIFEGTVSHPFTQIIIYGVLNSLDKSLDKEKIYQGIADNFGDYRIVFSQNTNGKNYEYFDVEFIKTPLSSLSKKDDLFKKAISWILKKIKPSIIYAQSSNSDNKISLRLDPIPTYLEGAAYDPSGKVLANTQVKIYIKGINVPYSTVKTNDQGYFKISSSTLPAFPYEIKYQDLSGKIVAVSTSKFITDNRNLISSQKIDLYSLKDEQGKLIVSKPKITQSPSEVSQKTLLPTKTESKSPSLNSGIVLILVVIFFSLILVGVIVYFYFRQNKSSSTLV